MLTLAATIGVPLPRGSYPTASLCSDDCPAARNGVCDDGGALFLEEGSPSADGPRLPDGKMAPEHTLRCDLGSDCTDCGPRHVARPATLTEAMPAAPEAADTAAWSSPPVKLLREMDVEVRAAWTRTQPAFIMPYTDPKKDIDVSGGMASGRMVEGTSSLYFGALSRECCADGGLMLDVGSNFGWFALYAATMGCRVVAWEPVPVFRAFLELGVRLNNLSHLVHVRAAAVSDVAGGNVTMRVPRKGLWGAASVDGLNVLRGSNEANSGTYAAVAPTETLDGLVAEQARQHGQSGRLGEAMAGHQRLIRLHLTERLCPRSHAPPKLTDFAACGRAGVCDEDGRRGIRTVRRRRRANDAARAAAARRADRVHAGRRRVARGLRARAALPALAAGASTPPTFRPPLLLPWCAGSL